MEVWVLNGFIPCECMHEGSVKKMKTGFGWIILDRRHPRKINGGLKILEINVVFFF